MSRGDRTGTVKMATRIRKIEAIIEKDPSRADAFADRLRVLKEKLAGAGCCLGCGRPLSDPESRARGYGSECWKRANDNG